ncbi:MAG: hypothetical protein IPN53_04285 [Comamonadaceae bacterium]|nr:hypothetical protein [Comamonadaceae bacterium]
MAKLALLLVCTDARRGSRQPDGQPAGGSAYLRPSVGMIKVKLNAGWVFEHRGR